MDFSEFNLSQLIPKVSAQSYDGVSQPTFGILNVTGPGISQAQLSITASNTSVGIGETFTVDVVIETGDFAINEYQIVLDYDTTKLSVLDSEPDTEGTQIEALDLVFAVDAGDNIVQDGRITLIARTPSGSALQVNRTVARITFQSQERGTTVIEPVSTFEGSKLLNANGIAVNASLNSLTLSIGDASTATTSSNTSIATSGSLTTTSNTSSTSANDGGVDQLPPTGIEDTLPLIPVIIGLLLVLVGVRLRAEANTKKVDQA